PGFEGGQNPFYRLLPKRGFNNAEFKTTYAIVNLDQIAAVAEKEITPELLVGRGIVKNLRDGVKILGTGDLKGAVTVKAHSFSASAKSKIEAKGGQAILLGK
ncbi:MAG TPA: 50S ribosomal protein L15, partial [Candidatus Omnitrophota bacterium]|nr:50S ribosomal protein L15 [Candidatus Omnitrophota bacterium]